MSETPVVVGMMAASDVHCDESGEKERAAAGDEEEGFPDAAIAMERSGRAARAVTGDGDDGWEEKRRGCD